PCQLLPDNKPTTSTTTNNKDNKDNKPDGRRKTTKFDNMNFNIISNAENNTFVLQPNIHPTPGQLIRFGGVGRDGNVTLIPCCSHPCPPGPDPWMQFLLYIPLIPLGFALAGFLLWCICRKVSDITRFNHQTIYSGTCFIFSILALAKGGSALTPLSSTSSLENPRPSAWETRRVSPIWLIKRRTQDGFSSA
ncbi:hypothetical protein PRIPAC_93760, partial [Pristionchus pacificus]|uniref:Uncharacterized protein n=1 Tax=Pristionchus pacificus TaxID=54126 RepID=A0A2A6CV87_PRIPA